MKILWLLKRLIALDVIFGRRSKTLHGIKDGGALANSINDINQAMSFNGSTIFNVNNSLNEPMGGHSHYLDAFPDRNFSYKVIVIPLTIKINQEMALYRDITIESDLTLIGDLSFME